MARDRNALGEILRTDGHGACRGAVHALLGATTADRNPELARQLDEGFDAPRARAERLVRGSEPATDA